ncbi:MAG: adenylate kinase [Chloroflexi bacterium]|nr:adenylate kinase [Chloroflexota bacterium]
MYLILLGPPGAGKGTQAASLSKELRAAHVASGDLFRQAQKQGTPLGLQAKAYMERGELVPDELTVRMVLERLEAPDCSGGVILDGFPRTLEQARALDQALGASGKNIDAVLYIKVSEDELVRRLGGRWLCRDCQTPYQTISSPPKVAGVCDSCGGELYQRPDDSRETVRTRLRVYEERTAPLIAYYIDLNKLIEIDGEQGIEEVRSEMLSALKSGVRAR